MTVDEAMKLKPGEKVLIFTGTPHPKLAEVDFVYPGTRTVRVRKFLRKAKRWTNRICVEPRYIMERVQ